MNEILKAIKERRSCKSYKPDMVPDEIIEQIVEGIQDKKGKSNVIFLRPRPGPLPTLKKKKRRPKGLLLTSVDR